MRSAQDIAAELDALGSPKPSWVSIGAVAASLALLRRWREENPDKARRYESLMCELREVEQHERELASIERMHERARASGLGERTREAAAEPKDTPALLATRQWLESGKVWLLLAGDVGTGKSVAAAWALLEVARAGQTVAFRRAAEVARLSGFDAGAEELARLKRVGLLVLDDLGTECATGWGTSILHELLDTRHESKLRTIVTSNLKRADARARLGDRLADRVQQDGRVVWLEGKSMRGAA
jgi:DNA replication protein DnaC